MLAIVLLAASVLPESWLGARLHSLCTGVLSLLSLEALL